MANGESNPISESIQAYIGLESEPEEGGPSICVEFDISIKIFLIAYALSLCDKENGDKS